MAKTKKKSRLSPATKQTAAPKATAKTVVKKKIASIKGSQKRNVARKIFFDVPCHFCGEDHLPESCETDLCLKCNKLASKCKCSEPDCLTGMELYEQIADDLWNAIPQEVDKQYQTRIQRDGLLKTAKYALTKYPKSVLRFWKKWLKGAKRPSQKKYGNCFEYSFSTMIDMEPYNGTLEQFKVAKKSVLLVHGYPTSVHPNGSKVKICHAWLEFTRQRKKLVLDCGSMEYVPRLFEVAEYYSMFHVQPSECRYFTRKEAFKQFNEENTWGPWGEPPEDAEVPGLKRKP
jgi:hypothetical protein